MIFAGGRVRVVGPAIVRVVVAWREWNSARSSEEIIQEQVESDHDTEQRPEGTEQVESDHDGI